MTEGSDQVDWLARGGLPGEWMDAGRAGNFVLELGTYINGTRIMMSGRQATDASGRNSEVMDWNNLSVSGQIVDTANDGTVWKNTRLTNCNTRPELVWVGVMEYSTAIWGRNTAGWVEGYDAVSYDP